MPDLEITCVACNQPFPFSESEQAFYEERGFQQPKRCRECRQSGRRGQRPQGNRGGAPRRDSGRNPGRGGPRGPSRGGPRRGGPGGRPPRRTLSHIGGRLVYTTHCAGCGAETEVPTPVGEGRSAFCPPCFAVRGKAWLEDEE